MASPSGSNGPFPPPLLNTWPPKVQVVLAGVVPVIFGIVNGLVLSSSKGVFLVLQLIAIAGGLWAGLEHINPREGAARGALGGLLFGTSILIGHAITGGSDHDVLPDPQLVLVVITPTLGALLGLLGTRLRVRLAR